MGQRWDITPPRKLNGRGRDAGGASSVPATSCSKRRASRDIRGLVDRAGDLVHRFLDRILRVTSGPLGVTLDLLRGSLSCNRSEPTTEPIPGLTDRLVRDARRAIQGAYLPLRVQLLASRRARREQNYWMNDLGWIERLVLTLNDAASCQKMFGPWGAALERVCVGNVPWTGGARGEDEPLILMLAVDMIRDAGFEPLWASNAEEAISILESRDDIRIVFTDINMPGSMDGIKLAQAVRGRWPPIRIIVTSGFGAGELKLLPEGSQFIPKPYSVGQISDALHSLAA